MTAPGAKQILEGGPARPLARPGARLAGAIREARFEDHRQIEALQFRNGLSSQPCREWCALWADNPAYRRTEGRLPIGWVLETPGGELAGFVGNLPSLYHFENREVLATSPISWAVDKEYRGHSMALMARAVNQPGVDLIMCTTLSPAAETAMRIFGVCRVPSGTWDHAAFWVTGYRGFARCALHALSAPQRNFLAYPLSAGLILRDTFARHLRRRASGFELELCGSFDERFDDFWERLKELNPHILLACRSRETLRWHFGRSLAAGKAWIIAASKGGRLVGYAVFDRQDHPEIGLRRMRLVDFQALPGSESAVRPILARALRKCREEGIHILENAGCWLGRLRVPAGVRPYHRTLKSWSFYYKACEQGLAERLVNGNVWAPTAYDGDSSV